MPFRDAEDLVFEQVVVDMWTAFARTFDPNPGEEFLRVRGYVNTSEAMMRDGKWAPVEVGSVNGTEVVRVLDVKSMGVGWMEQGQCEVLGFPLTFYETE